MHVDRCAATYPHPAHGPYGAVDCPGVPMPRPAPTPADDLADASAAIEPDDSPTGTPPPKPSTTVTITTSGASVTVTSTGPRLEIQREAQELHREVWRRCVAAPDGLGGRI